MAIISSPSFEDSCLSKGVSYSTNGTSNKAILLGERVEMYIDSMVSISSSDMEFNFQSSCGMIS